MTFQLDTAGEIITEDATAHRWGALDAFTQGYIEALFGWARENVDLETARWRDNLGFSDLAPETLARIMADCEKRKAAIGPAFKTVWLGREFWEMRQRAAFAGGTSDWPPLTAQLGDDGKVRLSQ